MEIVERCVWIDRFDQRFGRKLLLALLRAASRKEGIYAQRAAEALCQIPEIGGGLEFKHRRYFRPALTWRQRLSVRIEMASFPGSIMDWVWEGGPITIAAWVQAESERPCERFALERCLNTLERQDRPVHGLIVLSRLRMPPEALPDPGHKAFLGSVLWSEAEPELRAIRPEGELASEDWSAILDDMCSSVEAG